MSTPIPALWVSPLLRHLPLNSIRSRCHWGEVAQILFRPNAATLRDIWIVQMQSYQVVYEVNTINASVRVKDTRQSGNISVGKLFFIHVEGENMSNLLFGKTIDQWTETELRKLIDERVPEGQIVEYKQGFNKNVPKCIASFANSLGGWLFVGISEESKEDTNSRKVDIPKEIVGIKDPNPCLAITHTIRDTVSPVPIFHPRVIETTEDEKKVLIVYVPGDQNTPFITLKDGVVYSRINSSSSPVNDRYVLESLIERGRRYSEEVEAFCRDDRIILSEESYRSKPWLHIYLIPYPLKERSDHLLVSKEKAFELLKISKERPYIHPDIGEDYFRSESDLWEFDSVRTTFDSFVFGKIWKTAYEKMATETLDQSELVELFVDGKSKFHIPLLEIRQEKIPSYVHHFNVFGTSNRILELLEGYKQRKESGKECESPVPHYYFFDFSRACWHLLVLLLFYKENIGTELRIDTVRMVIEISVGSNYYTVPLWFDQAWVEMTNNMGVTLPIVQGGLVSFARNEQGILVDIEDFSNKEWEEAFGNLIGLAFGLMIKEEAIREAFELIIKRYS